jgi:hypothetical protein
MTTKVLSKLEPKNSGAFPTHSDIHTEGGFQVRADTTDRDSIPTLNRKEGMWVKLLSDGKIYTLSGGITNGDWTEVSFSAGAAIIFDGGTTSENINSNRVTLSSPIDNTKNGIVNLSSDSTGTATGAIANYVTISGGDGHNTQSIANYATIGGGVGNGSNDLYATVGGGFQNVAASESATISGGAANTATGLSSTISGGNTNSTNGDYNFIGGGNSINTSGLASTISGGQNNTTSNDWATVGGGTSNQATGQSSTVSGGNTNTANDTGATVCGGYTNAANGQYSTVIGGQFNSANENSSIAMGVYTVSDKVGQLVHSAGNFGNVTDGSSQFSRVVHFAESTGGTPDNFRDGINTTNYIVQDLRTYAMRVTIVASEISGTNTSMQVFNFLASVATGGAITLTGTAALTSPLTPDIIIGTPYDIDYTTAANLLTFTLTTTPTVRATATIEATELLF